MIIRQAQMADLDAIYAIELENFSPEEAISRKILAKHIEAIPFNFFGCRKKWQDFGLFRRSCPTRNAIFKKIFPLREDV